ncbi:Winged helix-turn-helix DNA-binding [Fibrobacter sp. UWCM]|uniref:ATP-binding protein n=1 Tax=Fibrobacter sp. UWCM TaxID=1896208 RepID=UPI000921C230|nr:ATP-binding protein [Fibrobacter sp. UWCM]SHG78882.1 Winged helix-turn-helix DNA-binding [Fibrobacter sp. UWCM]
MATKVSIKECQYAEFKQSWQDEYLKWICAFANTEGGSLFVGVDDKGYTLFMQGRTWDSVPVPGISTKELDHGALKLFREKAVESQRLDKKAAGVSVQNLLQNLRCTEGSHLTRAAMMCFHPDPESWVTGAYIKIGFYYTETTPIQIKIYSDRIWMWNPGNMPEEVKVKDLFKKHVSKPRNPNIANVFFKSGYVESWGRGYYNIELACEETDSKLPKPKAEFGGLTVECRASDQYKELASKWNIGGANPPINPPINLPINLPINSTQKALLNLLQENNSYTYDKLADKMQKTRETIRENLKKLQELGLIRRVGARKNGHWEIIEK